MRNGWVATGASIGAATVVLGAFGAHLLEERLSADALELWRTGVLYQGLHALALVGWGQFRAARNASALPGWSFLLGTILFSGSLYLMAVGAPGRLGIVTPFGGLLWIVGWLAFARQALRDAPG